MYGDIVGTAEIHFPPQKRKGFFKRSTTPKPISFFFTSQISANVAEAGEDAQVEIFCSETPYFTNVLKLKTQKQGRSLVFQYDNMKRTFD